MATFHATVESAADLKATRQEVWDVLTNPKKLAELTPLLSKIDASGDSWVWHMTKVSGLGLDLTPCFTEKMVFDEGKRIDFTHLAPKGSNERFGVEGRYDLADTPDGVHLAISLTVCADLPLPKVASPAVTRVMKQTMTMMGDRFAKNLLGELKTTAVPA